MGFRGKSESQLYYVTCEPGMYVTDSQQRMTALKKKIILVNVVTIYRHSLDTAHN